MNYWIVVVISLLFAALFSGLESAFVASGQLQPEQDHKSYPLRYRLLRLVNRNPGYYHVTILLGYTLSLVIFTISTSLLLESCFREWFRYSMWAITLLIPVVVFIIFVFGVFLPKLFAGIFPHSALAILVLPFFLFYLLIYPVTVLIVFSVKAIIQITTGNNHTAQPGNRVFRKAGPGSLWFDEPLNQADEVREEEKEVILFRNALDFSKVKLREIMVPRNEIEVLDINAGIDALRQKFVDTGYSRILFYEGNKDNIVGYVHTSAIFQKAQQIKPFLKNVLIVPETMAANRLLSRFIREHRSIALVVDEFGGTAGLVTSEDILEEIFGEIEDEHDTDDFTGKKINDRQYVLSGRFEIDALNDKYNLNIPESEHYETLAGFILFYLESIPVVNETVTIGRLHFRILKATRTKVELVYLTVSED